MKTLTALLGASALIFTIATQSQEIKTEAEAEAFLQEYCVSLINEIAKAVELQKGYAAREEWDEFMEQSAWIAGVADVYGNLCDD